MVFQGETSLRWPKRGFPLTPFRESRLGSFRIIPKDTLAIAYDFISSSSSATTTFSSKGLLTPMIS